MGLFQQLYLPCFSPQVEWTNGAKFPVIIPVSLPSDLPALFMRILECLALHFLRALIDVPPPRHREELFEGRDGKAFLVDEGFYPFYLFNIKLGEEAVIRIGMSGGFYQPLLFIVANSLLGEAGHSGYLVDFIH